MCMDSGPFAPVSMLSSDSSANSQGSAAAFASAAAGKAIGRGVGSARLSSPVMTARTHVSENDLTIQAAYTYEF